MNVVNIIRNIVCHLILVRAKCVCCPWALQSVNFAILKKKEKCSSEEFVEVCTENKIPPSNFPRFPLVNNKHTFFSETFPFHPEKQNTL